MDRQPVTAADVDALLPQTQCEQCRYPGCRPYAEAIIAAARVAGRPLCLGEGNLLPITTAEYPLPASRPANSCLDTKRFISTFGLALPEWQNGLAHVLRLML